MTELYMTQMHVKGGLNHALERVYWLYAIGQYTHVDIREDAPYKHVKVMLFHRHGPAFERWLQAWFDESTQGDIIPGYGYPDGSLLYFTTERV